MAQIINQIFVPTHKHNPFSVGFTIFDIQIDDLLGVIVFVVFYSRRQCSPVKWQSPCFCGYYCRDVA